MEKKEENVFDCKDETSKNISFLMACLDRAHIPFSLKNAVLTLKSEPIHEEKWIEVLNFSQDRVRGRGGDLWFSPGEEEPKVEELDIYISGIVRQLNRLGFYTEGSCDGHENRPAHVLVTKGKDINLLVEVLLALGMKREFCRDYKQHYHISLHLKRNELLDMAEKLSLIEDSWLEQGHDFIKEQMFCHTLEELLSIPGASGNESKIRQVVREKITPFVDFITEDRYGNLLAEKTYGGGHGPTILLSAHLDTVFEIEPNHTISKEDGIWTSSKGILGADDRAGVAVLLETAKNLMNSSFSGKVKFIFSVEEEIGLCGAHAIDEYFIWGVNATIVVDHGQWIMEFKV